MKLMVISLCTQGIMREHFIYYCREFAKHNDLYCITNSNVTNDDLQAIETLNVGYNRTNPFGYFAPGKLRSMKKFIDRIKPDIVYIFTHHATSVLIPPMLRKYKVLYKVHDPSPHPGVGKLNGFIISLQLKIYSKFADRLIVAGNELKRQVLKKCNIDESKIEVIPFGVLDDFIDDSIEPSEEDIDLLFFGRIEPYKGLDVLFEAIEKLDTKPITYVAGGGDVFAIHPNVKKIPENVKMLGFVENERLISYVKKCKAIVLPYHEASGTLTVCQAFYYGKPVIVSDVGVLPEYTADGGLVFTHSNADELAERIKELLGSEELQHELSINARKMYEKTFTIENAGRMHQKVFESVLEEN